jgi:hypothetical protein
MHLVMGQDERVAGWMFAKTGCKAVQYNLAVGLAEEEDDLVAGILFTGYNGSDAEVHFYGPTHLTRRTLRTIFLIALRVFNLNRLTVRTRKPGMARGVRKLGAVYEGKVRRLYGPTDDDRHAGLQFAFFREEIERLAGAERAMEAAA